MKRFTLTFTILCAFFAVAYAGTERYSGKEKEVLQPAPPACEWYRAHEWDFDIWGTYAFSGNTGHRNNTDFPTPEDVFINGNGNPHDFKDPPGAETIGVEKPEQIDIGHWNDDRFLNRDGAMGGGADIKYFFSKYWALGAEGLVLDCNNNIGGGGFGTFTFRWPIGCSRFAPYVWGGFGALSGGSHTIRVFQESHQDRVLVPGQPPTTIEHEFEHNLSLENKRTNAAGQFGGGLEVRITRHIGVMGDFAWNVQDRPNNDFGMGRLGVTLSY